MKVIKRISLVIVVVITFSALSACNDEFDEFNVTQYPVGNQQDDNDPKFKKTDNLQGDSGSSLEDNID